LLAKAGKEINAQATVEKMIFFSIGLFGVKG